MFDINQVPNQAGRVAIVTGANVGLGFETTRALAKKEMTVIMACRNQQKAEDARAQIIAEVPDAKLEILLLDLSDLASVRSFSENFLTKYEQLDLLINNAGVMIPPYEKTVDGFELQMGANYFGHFLLTSLLLDTLEKTDASRIVQLSSVAHRGAKIFFDDMHFEKKYSRIKAYGQSKLAMLMFAYELDRQLKARGYKTLSVAAHPGVSDTNLSRYIPKVIMTLFGFLLKRMTQPAIDGTQPQLYAALGSDILGGDYTGPDGPRENSGKAIKVGSKPNSKDESVAKKLWETSINLTGAKWFS
jgi:NAD(P)-dependent dehydrogenase (short-subunit alcohol dehydrogenase family)